MASDSADYEIFEASDTEVLLLLKSFDRLSDEKCTITKTMLAANHNDNSRWQKICQYQCDGGDDYCYRAEDLDIIMMMTMVITKVDNTVQGKL
jgi:hypothetical protein